MNTLPCPVYTFRSNDYAHSGGTVVSVAPLDRVVETFGDVGHWRTGGLLSAFGRVAVYLNGQTGERYAGVWGARLASRFRSAMRAHQEITIIKAAPPAYLKLREGAGRKRRRPLTPAPAERHALSPRTGP